MAAGQLPRGGTWAPLSALLCLLLVASSAAKVTVLAPANPPTTDNVVFSNFLGISLELSFINYYFGNSTAEIPPPFIQYLSRLCQHASGKRCRIRLGGNSMDSSTYVPDQTEPIIFTNPDANSNDQPVTYGPHLFDTMKGVSTAIGGAQYLIGLSLRDPKSPNIALLAGDSHEHLGDDLDAWLLGNEPDLYTRHGQRPNLENYTVNNYIQEYQTVFDNLKTTPKGDILSLNEIAGPTICCFWDLAAVLQSGWLDRFREQLKYITVQRYPTNSCFGPPPFGIEWYLVHANTVKHATWSAEGLQLAAQAKKPVLMDEFNTVSCGGYAGISDVFGAALWITDYSLQLAVQGYAGAYIHTRERGVTYNLFDPPATVAGGTGPWTTNPSYYGMIPVAEALEAPHGSRVVDLNLAGMDKEAPPIAGYAIYDGAATATGAVVHSLVLINFADAAGAMAEYALDGAYLQEGAATTNVTVRYLVAPSIGERTNIAYGGKTYAGVGDGVAVDATFVGSVPDRTVVCDRARGCTVEVPGPGLAVLFIGGQKNATAVPDPSSSSSSSSGAPSPTDSQSPDGAVGGVARSGSGVLVLGLIVAGLYLGL